MLLMGQTMGEILISWGTTIFLLQHLGFILKLEKSILNPFKLVDLLSVVVNSVQTTISLLQKNLQQIQDQFHDHYMKGFFTVLEVTKLIGLLASTIPTVLPAQLNFHYLEQQRVNAFKHNGSYQEVLYLKKDSKEELQWWLQNLKICKVLLMIQHRVFLH